MRKRPQQQRSRELVSRLVDATAQAITVRGLDDFTTQHVADFAAVSVGSLYQYFDSKEDLVEALLERVSLDLAGGLNHFVLSKTTELRQMVQMAIRFGFAFLKADGGLAAELVKNWHKLPAKNFIVVLQNTLLDFMRMYLLKNPLVVQPERLQVRTYIIANALVFTMIRALSEPSPFISEQDLSAELEQMVLSYLQS
ncbi:MAG: TetR/AcrR family transcriptional regulator [Burkholderiales bacterium]|nr:TetR/AcrR family transcriptional regulator [Burkholderiales bacterium]